MEEIVISGMSGRFPEADNVEEFWENLINGVDMVTTNDRRWPVGFLGLPQRTGTLKSDLTKFDANFFGIFPKQAERVDPQIRQLLEVTYEAILDSGYNPAQLRGENIGVYVGASAHDTFEACRKHPDIASGYDITGSACCMLANRVSYAFDFHGPSFCIDTFCSSSHMALHQALNAIRAGECDGAIVSGVNLLMNPMTSLQILGVGALAPDGKCKTFDESGNGFVRSEAIVTLFIQKKNLARKSYATLVHSKSNTDGYKIKGVSYPSGQQQQKLLEQTYAEANINPLDVFYVEPHGTGTEAGDPQEVNAIAEVFTKGRSEPLLTGATKSNMGHAEPAAALCAVTKVLLALRNGVIPPNLHFNSPNKNIPALIDGRIKVVTKPAPVTGSLVGVNSTGLGGSNIHVIIKANQKSDQSISPKAPVLIPISGRTEEAVSYALQGVTESPRNYEFHNLLQRIAEDATPGHSFRGFSVLAQDENPLQDIQEAPTDRPPLWFVFSGMGTLWKGMTKDLMDFPMFADSIYKSAEILKPLGMDLLYVLFEGEEELLDRHMGTCFVAMGVAFIDMLKAINIIPDGFIGHSAGELMCGYIDGVISHRDALICYFFKDECVLKVNGGGMAAVGLSWEDALKLCPPGIYPACHNAENNVTVSGPREAISEFVQELKAKEIFAREVATGGVAYHSPYLAPILPTFEAHTRAIIVESKTRSSKWISSSRPESDWDIPMSSSDYVVNNMRSPVLFHGAVKHIPDNAVVLEVSAHSLFVSMLKKSLPQTCNVMGLIRKGKGNNAVQFLTAVGKLYQLGFDINIANLYPTVEYPVPAQTPMIAPLVKWDHSESYSLPDYLYNPNNGETAVEVSLNKEEDSYIAGHKIDGRVLYPATGYLTLIWKKFASLHGKPYLQQPVEFSSVRFEQATILPQEGTVKLNLSISSKTGEFEIRNNDATVVSGIVKVPDQFTLNSLDKNYVQLAANGTSSKHQPLLHEDIYKELRIQGYEYQNLFKGLCIVDNEGKWAKVSWNDNWVTFLDTMLQFPIVSKSQRGLYIPTNLQKVVINPKRFLETLENNRDFVTEGVPVIYEKKFETLYSSAIQIKGLKTNIAPKRAITQDPVLEEAKFMPYQDITNITHSSDCIRFFVDIVAENICSTHITIREEAELIKDSSLKEILNNFAVYPNYKVEALLVSRDSDPEQKKELESLGVSIPTVENPNTSYHLLLNDKLEVPPMLKEKGFVLLKLKNGFNTSKNLVPKDFIVVASRRTTEHHYYLLRKISTLQKYPLMLYTDLSHYQWIPRLQEELKNGTDESNIILMSSNQTSSGIVGLVKCLRKEPGGNKIRCLLTSKPIDLTTKSLPLISQVINADLVMNVIDQEIHGSIRHIKLDTEALRSQETFYAYINAETRGDLSSLKFIEAPKPVQNNEDSEICEVFYSSLNFRDCMLATGKLPPEALPGKLSHQECILGLEFAGLSETDGRRVAGMVEAKGLATYVTADKLFLWEIPQNWTMEEGATIPVAYSTAYYSLIVRGRMKPGQSVLIHSGSGGVGQAAIAIALSMNCKVYTTVGSDEKRNFLQQRFPQLTPECFANSRDLTFEQHIMNQTDGQGVDFVLNSLAEEKLQASIRCLAEGGVFLEIGKYDLSKNNALGMSVFLKNITFHGILLDALFEKSSEEKLEVVRLVSEGIQSGIVKPLNRKVFMKNEIEEAFRYMATGKHIGKVVLKLKDEMGNLSNPVVVNAVPRTFFDNSKVYIVVGGLGGFGMELCGWLVDRGVKKLVIVSRSSVKNGYQALLIRRWTECGVNVSVSNDDITNLKGTTTLLSNTSKLGDIGGIFNLAMVLRDAVFENQTLETFLAAVKPKLDATKNLDTVSRKICKNLDYFVVFSSAACGRGNAGQTNYGYANSGMERICEQRRRENLHGLAIQWGAIGDVGVIQEHMGGNDVVLGGTVPQRLSSCLNVLDLFLRSKKLTVVASTVFPEVNLKSSGTNKLSLLSSVSNILGLKSSSVVNKDITLGDLGIDSLMAVELKQILEWHCDLRLSTAEIRELKWSTLEEYEAQSK